MKKFLAFLLAFSMMFCFFSCKKEEPPKKKSSYEIYSDAVLLTSQLTHQKFNISCKTLDLTTDTESEILPTTFCKLIKKDGNITFYSERTVSVSNGEDTVTPTLYHHYIDGIMYQTFTDTKMKHALSAEEFEENHLGFQDIMLSLPENSLPTPSLISENKDGGKDLYYNLDVSVLPQSELDKLYRIFELYSDHGFDGDYEISGGMSINVATDFDGYFTSYVLGFGATGISNGTEKTLALNVCLEIIHPGNEFVINPLGNTGDYTEGSFEIG